MQKKRVFVDGAAYLVTSKTDHEAPVFATEISRRIMLPILQEAKEKFGFRLLNFCIMPAHIDLLIVPGDGGNLSQIMRWIKTKSSRRWNFVHGSTGHLWGERFFARAIKDSDDFDTVMTYIDRNPVEAGLAQYIGDWRESGAYHISEGIAGLVDYTVFDQPVYKYHRLNLPNDDSHCATKNQLQEAFVFDWTGLTGP
jgi:putative transposase